MIITNWKVELLDYFILGYGMCHPDTDMLCGFMDDVYSVPLTRDLQNYESHSATPWDAKSNMTYDLHPPHVFMGCIIGVKTCDFL